MTTPYLKKCERCGELFELPDNYESYRIPALEKIQAKFVTTDYRYAFVDLCEPCIKEFDILFKAFMNRTPPREVDDYEEL